MDEKSLNAVLWRGVLVIVSVPVIIFIIFLILNHNLNGIQDWLIPIATFEFLITAAISAWVTVNNYALKIEREKRLSDTASIESDVRLLRLFSEMMQIANCRYDPIVSEKVIEGLFSKGIVTAKDYTPENIRELQMKLGSAMYIPFYGLPAQESAIAAIFTLGRENPILINAAIDGLTAVKQYFIDDPRFGKDSIQTIRIENYIKELSSIRNIENSQSV
jgi:hypothetical protein